MLFLVDAIDKWQMEWPLQGGFKYQLVNLIMKWQMEYPYCQGYFNLSSEVISRTSSHMCGRWYLPMFLLRDGLLTLMYYASFIALLRFWSSLPTMLKLSMVTL